MVVIACCVVAFVIYFVWENDKKNPDPVLQASPKFRTYIDSDVPLALFLLALIAFIAMAR